MKKSKDFLTSRIAAEALGVSLTTVQHWVESGVLPAWKTAGGHRRIARQSVDDMLRQQREAAQTNSTRQSFTIVVVEDDPLQQQLYEIKFAEWNQPIELVCADNGFAGLLEIGRRKPDVIISDLDMPGMDGFEMIRSISDNKQLEDVQIIVVTGLDADEIEVRGGLPADTTILPKPVIFDELKSLLAFSTRPLAK